VKDPLVLAITLAALVSAPVAAQTQTSPSDRAAAEQQQRVDRAKKRCRLNHGVDCDKPEGLKEWVLQERTRQEAVRDRRLPTQPEPTPSRP
jgi:aminoglycoside phosphotransferase (APT) family kinase protein